MLQLVIVVGTSADAQLFLASESQRLASQLTELESASQALEAGVRHPYVQQFYLISSVLRGHGLPVNPGDTNFYRV